MRRLDVSLDDVQKVYAGPERQLWQLIMGEQVHAGGMAASMRLADAAAIEPDWHGVDLCCCIGGGVRFLVKRRGCRMVGVDGTMAALDEARRITAEDGLADRAEYRLGDVMAAPAEDEEFDFVWGEDAWCYVVDKGKLISEAFRILKPGGTIAFTDWVEGPQGLADDEAERICRFMTFPYLESLPGYGRLLREAGFVDIHSLDLTIEFAGHVDLYIRMLTEQLTYDALKIIGDDTNLFRSLGGEMDYMRQRCHEGKMGKGQWVARKPHWALSGRHSLT